MFVLDGTTVALIFRVVFPFFRKRAWVDPLLRALWCLVVVLGPLGLFSGQGVPDTLVQVQSLFACSCGDRDKRRASRCIVISDTKRAHAQQQQCCRHDIDIFSAWRIIAELQTEGDRDGVVEDKWSVLYL